MYQFSDSDSIDSDEGIRYKTDSIRNKKSNDKDNEREKRSLSHRSRRKSRSRSRSRSRQHSERKLKKRKRDHSSDEKAKRKHSENKHKVREISDHKKHKKKRDRSKSKETSSTDRLKKAIDGEEKSSFSPNLPNKEDSSDKKEPSPQKDISQSKEEIVESLPFGPVLPPKTESDDKLPENGNNFGPQLPPHLAKKTEEEDSIIGPILPPHFITVSSLDDESSVDLDESYFKSTTTSNNQNDAIEPDVSSTVIGPVLPPHLRQQLENNSDISKEEESEDVYGPVPVGAHYSQAHLELEERALQMKMDQLEPADNKQAVREEWMLTLPEGKAANLGLGPRQFRAKAGPDLSDRSSWTDTPEDKAKKKEGKVPPVVSLQREAEKKQIESRNKEQEAIAKKHKKEKESLLEIHRKKLKNEKSESGPSERRPFSREIDLQVNRFDEAQKKAVLKKAQLLDNRFSSGESKFL